MAAQTVTTAVNYDSASISGLLDGETITINGGSVTVDADVRWNQQAAVLGNVTLSATLGGSFVLDGTKVWEVPFSASTGNVPTQAALGSNGVTGGTSGATGELTRVWATGSLTPATAGGAMPATGWIKLRSKTGDFTAGETITLPGGATITASGPGRRSWINIVGFAVATGGSGATGGRLTIPRRGTFRATGDWYELGTTNGADDQTFQFPVADQCPAIWIETAPSSGVYEIWLNSGDRWTASTVASGDRRGMYFGMSATTGVITLAARTGNTAGLKPPSGCKVRVPNVILSQAIATDYATNILAASFGWRYGFATSPGAVVIDRVSSNWLHHTTDAFQVDIQNSGIGGTINVTNTGSTTTLTNVGVGLVDTLSTYTPIAINTCYGGGSLTDVFVARRTATSNGFGVVLTDTANFSLTRVRSDVLGPGTNTTQSLIELVRAIDTTLVDCVAVGGSGLEIAPGFGVSCTGFKYSSRAIGTTTASDAANGISVTGGSADVVIDGFSAFDGIANVHPYGVPVSLTLGVNGCLIRNVGTPAAPYNMGTANGSGGFLLASQARDVVVRSVYAVNARAWPFNIANTVQGFDAYNFWGDTGATPTIQAINATIRGGRYTPPPTGQSAVYGTHWQDAWASTTAGRIVISCNEPTTASAGQCAFTLDTANGSGFTSAGNVAMTRVGDEVVWTMPYFCLGLTGFANSAPTITGTNASNHTLQFQWDTGAGWNGTWLALTGANLAGIGAINPATGVKLRVRATVNTASTSNLLTYISIATVTNATAQQTVYPLPGALLTVSSLVPNSRVKVTRVDTGALLANDSTTGTSLTLDIPYTGSVRVEVRNASGSPSYRPWVTQTQIATGTTTTVTALQEQD